MTPDHEQHWHELEHNENTELEIVDLAPQETYGLAGALVDFSLRIFAGMRSVRNAFKVSFSAKDEDDERVDDECEFDLRFVDLAALPHSQEQETEEADTVAYVVQDSDSVLKAPAPTRKWQQLRIFSPFTFLLLLITALLAGSAPYQPVTRLTVARPSFSTSIAVNDMSGATFNPVDQGQGNGLQMRYSDNSTVVIPGVAMGHSMTPGGVASWSAASMPASCAVNNDTDAVYTSGHISLWLVGASYPYSLVHLQHMTSSNLNSWKGWQLLIGILMKRGFTGPVTLTISNQSFGPSPSFHGLLDEPPITSLIVDLRKVPAYVAQSALRSRIIWSIPLYLPGAGCYTIQTQWPGGAHNLTISAGQ